MTGAIDGIARADRTPPVCPPPSSAEVPIRQLTRGPGFHWFSYYDKLQFDPSGRYLLDMCVDFEGRQPRPDDVVRLGMIDTEDGDRYVDLEATTTAWCWQQGCMLQWLPGSDCEVLWNDRDDDRYVTRIMNVKTGARRTIPMPIYTVAPDGRYAYTADFRRINDMRPGYGYAGPTDPHAEQLAPEESGIWRVDLKTGRSELICSIARAAAVPIPADDPYYPQADMPRSKHYFNHLLVNTDGTRIEFLHRWRSYGSSRSWKTRMFTVAPDGTDLRTVVDAGMTSHFIWRDPHHILAWSRHKSRGSGFYLFDERDATARRIETSHMPSDGHCNYLRGSAADWIVNDTYPRGKDRLRELYLYHMPTGRRVDIGKFHAAAGYDGYWRVDLHPRVSPCGTKIVIDSCHNNQGRQQFILDVAEIVGE